MKALQCGVVQCGVPKFHFFCYPLSPTNPMFCLLFCCLSCRVAVVIQGKAALQIARLDPIDRRNGSKVPSADKGKLCFPFTKIRLWDLIGPDNEEDQNNFNLPSMFVRTCCWQDGDPQHPDPTPLRDQPDFEHAKYKHPAGHPAGNKTTSHLPHRAGIAVCGRNTHHGEKKGGEETRDFSLGNPKLSSFRVCVVHTKVDGRFFLENHAFFLCSFFWHLCEENSWMDMASGHVVSVEHS